MNTTLTERHDALMREYGAIFSDIMDMSYEWDSTSNLFTSEEDAFNEDDVRLIVDRYGDVTERGTELKDLVRTTVVEWTDYIKDCYEFNVQYINLKSWIDGAPRMSESERAHLRGMKEELYQEIMKYQDKYGLLDTRPDNVKLHKPSEF